VTGKYSSEAKSLSSASLAKESEYTVSCEKEMVSYQSLAQQSVYYREMKSTTYSTKIIVKVKFSEEGVFCRNIALFIVSQSCSRGAQAADCAQCKFAWGYKPYDRRPQRIDGHGCK